ncbi:MAG: glycosyltransferase [Isosphaeraceae bacterium]|nr:glycosyltransferase [Isosphaeraceae bacterium]
MTHPPRVTVGVPVYNGERFLDSALASVLDQTYDDYEVIVLDNASIDGTAAIAREYERRDRRFRYVRNARNIGPTANFDAIVPMAKAPLFKWLAADDLLRATFLERCVALLDGNPEVVLATARLDLIGGEGQPLAWDPEQNLRIAAHGERVLMRPSIAGPLADPYPVLRFRHLLTQMFGIQISTYMFGVIRTDVLRRTSLEGSYPGADKILLAELVLRGPFAEVPEVLWDCRIHPQHLGALAPVQLTRQMRPDRSIRLPMRIYQALGYAAAIWRAPLGPRCKTRCLVATMRRGLAAGGTGLLS